MEELRKVYDPETDLSIVDMGFVKDVKVNGSEVEVTLLPPTFWCSPPFMYMIMRDVKEKLRERYTNVKVRIIGHHDSERLNSCIERGITFEECYPNEAGGYFYDLYKTFIIKRIKARSYRVMKIIKKYGLKGDEDFEVLGDTVRVGNKVIGDKEEVKELKEYVELLKAINTKSIIPTEVHEAKLYRLSLGINGEFCKLLGESRRERN
ncbi:metal-sulfur cluster assembly factor [Acidianus sp. RZ1]|uniref:metal-sulfur cluster assembly factor n=1 Tax=Acidianus sp. RZ1 TaxID=1540082 RepID=UPI001490A65C|nr:iron-sulfur cluster assembly protein [Acidianus sp. RZ1]NON62564.1 iron-sulfur cluster assembly protein [Acidianus sp. RZ1]